VLPVYLGFHTNPVASFSLHVVHQFLLTVGNLLHTTSFRCPPHSLRKIPALQFHHFSLEKACWVT
jgi:hypothetical protein